MTTWVRRPDDGFSIYAGIALHLVDDFTGAPPIGSVSLDLEIQVPGGWAPLDRPAQRTPSGIYAYPALGLHPDPVAVPTVRYRLLVTAELYRPAYLWTLDGLEFDVPSYNQSQPPAITPILPELVPLYPAPNYSFAPHMRVLRGRVEDAATDPVANARVSSSGERVLSDVDGSFALPLRWPDPTAVIPVEVDHVRSGRSVLMIMQLPDVLGTSQTLTVL